MAGKKIYGQYIFSNHPTLEVMANVKFGPCYILYILVYYTVYYTVYIFLNGLLNFYREMLHWLHPQIYLFLHTFTLYF